MSADLRGRIVAGVPAVIFAIFIVIQGGWWFAAGALLLGLACLHELYGLFDDVRPARLAGFLGLIGLVVAAMEATSCTSRSCSWPSSPCCSSSP